MDKYTPQERAEI
ncbi:hypothetical protein GWI33_009630 [Rhynchophorus ferrugineus]|uniref:Uncharacterized protein n=3 Tax=Endopterygota TaxID=33392 RepID=A0A834IMX2_RHYFE|nr:hypothetical protein GWI33_009630 [Rhynchophorus ferrugineus]